MKTVFYLHVASVVFRHEQAIISCRVPMNLMDPANSVSHTIVDLKDRYESKRMGFNDLMWELTRLMVSDVKVTYRTGKVVTYDIDHNKIPFTEYR